MNAVIESYLASATKSDVDGTISEDASMMNTGIVKYKKIQLLNSNGVTIDRVNYMADINLEMQLSSKQAINDVILDVRITTRDGIEIVHTMNKYASTEKQGLKEGLNQINCKIKNQLQPGNYSITIGVHETNGLTMDFVENVLDFSVMQIGEGQDAGYTYDFQMAHVRFQSKWEVK